MSQMLLSINPEHVENILNKNKRFEYRKTRCKSNIDKILIYATSPIMRVVGEAEVVDIIEDNLDKVWEITHEYAGITRPFYDNYFRGKTRAVAYKLGKITQYTEPKYLSDYGVNSAPQSFVYVGVAT